MPKTHSKSAKAPMVPEFRFILGENCYNNFMLNLLTANHCGISVREAIRNRFGEVLNSVELTSCVLDDRAVAAIRRAGFEFRGRPQRNFTIAWKPKKGNHSEWHFEGPLQSLYVYVEVGAYGSGVSVWPKLEPTSGAHWFAPDLGRLILVLLRLSRASDQHKFLQRLRRTPDGHYNATWEDLGLSGLETVGTLFYRTFRKEAVWKLAKSYGEENPFHPRPFFPDEFGHHFKVLPQYHDTLTRQWEGQLETRVASLR